MKTIGMLIGGLFAAVIGIGTPFVMQDAPPAVFDGPEAVVEQIGGPVDVEHHGGPHIKMAAQHDEYLADALGITVEELQAARDEAHLAMIDDALAEGTISEEQAELRRAGIALKNYIDRGELAAQVLGITVEELEAAIEDGTRLRELVEEAGLTGEEFRTGMEAAFEAKVQQAVDEGVITAEQAELVLEKLAERPGPGGRRGPDGRGPGR